MKVVLFLFMLFSSAAFAGESSAKLYEALKMPPTPIESHEPRAPTQALVKSVGGLVCTKKLVGADAPTYSCTVLIEDRNDQAIFDKLDDSLRTDVRNGAKKTIPGVIECVYAVNDTPSQGAQNSWTNCEITLR